MTTTIEEILAPLATVPPARRATRRRRPGRWLVPAVLAAVVALFVAVQPRGARPTIEASAVARSGDPEQVAAAAAQSMVGVPFRWGGADPTGFDTSGLVVWSFGQAGVTGLPHYTGSLWGQGEHVQRRDLRLGDVVFFGGLSHVGIYLGDGRFVHATPPSVTVDSLAGFALPYDGAVRIGTPAPVTKLSIRRMRAENAHGAWALRPERAQVLPAAADTTYLVWVVNRGSRRAAVRVHFSIGGRAAKPRMVLLGPGATGPVRFHDRSPRIGVPLVARAWITPSGGQGNTGRDVWVIRLRYERP
jgi:cell wall-associated NlpC family hydrolase